MMESNTHSVDACANIVQSLLNHSCGDNAFSRKAIESLVKKTKEKREELDALITAITTSGGVPTGCVTIQKTLDGRVQVGGRKGFPHVIYARIWRWPDLTRNELQPSSNCATAQNNASDLTCINPYHYDRVIVPPGVDLASMSGEPSENRPQMFDDQQFGSFASNYQAQYGSPVVIPEPINHYGTATQSLPPQPPLPPAPNLPIACNSQTVALPAQPTSSLPVPSSLSFLSTRPLPEFWCSINYLELDQQIGGTFRVPSCYSGVTIDGFTRPSRADRFCIGFLCNVHRPPTVQNKTRLHIGKGVRLESTPEGDVWLQNLADHDISVFISSPYLDQQSRRSVAGLVHKIYARANVKVFDLNETYQLLSYKAEQAKLAASTEAAAVAGTVAMHQQLENIDPIGAGGIALDDLGRFCTLNISFIKGWGLDYPRKTLKECPCWVQVHLHRALQILDEVFLK